MSQITVEVPANILERIVDAYDMIERVRIQKNDPTVGRSWAFTPYTHSFKAKGRPDKPPEEIAAAAVAWILDDRKKITHAEPVRYRVHLDCRGRDGKVFARYAEFDVDGDEDDGPSIRDEFMPSRGKGFGRGRFGHDEDDDPEANAHTVALAALTSAVKAQERLITQMHTAYMDREKSFATNMKDIFTAVTDLVKHVPESFNKAITLMEASHAKSEAMLELGMYERIEASKIAETAKTRREAIQAIMPMAGALAPALLAKWFGIKPAAMPAAMPQAAANAKPAAERPAPEHEREDGEDVEHGEDGEDAEHGEDGEDGEDNGDHAVEENADPSALNQRISALVGSLPAKALKSIREIIGGDNVDGLLDPSRSVETTKALIPAIQTDEARLEALGEHLGDQGQEFIDLAMEAYVS